MLAPPLNLSEIFEGFTERLAKHYQRTSTCETADECRALAEETIAKWKQYDTRGSEYNGTAYVLHNIERRIVERENGIRKRRKKPIHARHW